jgi:hypothetical protein
LFPRVGFIVTNLMGSPKSVVDFYELVEESDFRFVLCGLSPHLKWQLQCVRLSDEFDTFDTRQAAIVELAPLDAY